MIIEAFLQPRLTGARFDDSSIPLEFLKDLAALEEMIVEVTKWKFIKDNPGRRRSPRGFTEGMALKLTGVEAGSARPVISLSLAVNTLFPVGNHVYAEDARDAVVRAIHAAEHGSDVSDHLPEKVLGYFDRFGRSLREGEAIEFEMSGTPSVARLTKETRRKLLLSSSAVKEFTEETFIRGRVPEVDQDNMTFELQLFDGRKIPAPVAPQHHDTIIKAFVGYRQGTRVLVKGVGRFNRSDRLLGFDFVEHVNIVDPMDASARLDELRSLAPGWFEGTGCPLSSSGLDWLSNQFETSYPDDVLLPFLYPTPDGAVQAEWTFGPAEITLEIELNSQQGVWHALNVGTGEDAERELDLNDPREWEWIAEEIRKIGGGKM